jgi:hypothetical protein
MKVLSFVSGGESFKAPTNNDEDLNDLFALIRVWAQKAKVGSSADLVLENVPDEEFAEMKSFEFPTLEDVKS